MLMGAGQAVELDGSLVVRPAGAAAQQRAEAMDSGGRGHAEPAPPHVTKWGLPLRLTRLVPFWIFRQTPQQQWLDVIH